MASDLTYHLTGGLNNTDPDLSLGGVGSTTVLSTTALNNLFDNVNPVEILGSEYIDYRAIDIKNDGDALARNVEFYLIDTTNAESTLAAWEDPAGVQVIINETTEPVGASGAWTQPLVGSRMSLGNLAAGATHRIWVRRTIDADAANLNDDTGTLNVWFS